MVFIGNSTKIQYQNGLKLEIVFFQITLGWGINDGPLLGVILRCGLQMPNIRVEGGGGLGLALGWSGFGFRVYESDDLIMRL